MKKTNNVNNGIFKFKNFVENSVPKVSELKYGDGTENEFIVKVFPVLPFTKRMEMVREIVNGVFLDDRNTVNTYAPEFLTLLQKYTVITFFTDLSLPKKLDDLWLVLNYTPIYDDVVKIVGENEINEIFKSADKAIDTYRIYLTTKNDVNALMNKIGGAINDIESKIPQEDIKAIASKIKNISNGASLKDIIGSIFANKSPNDIGA